jgi:hypothetical protein
MIGAGYDIEVYDTFIPQEVIDKEIEMADLLLSVFDVNYRTIDNQWEVYGTTKVTALAYLALIHAKVAILPSTYGLPREMHHRSFRITKSRISGAYSGR